MNEARYRKPLPQINDVNRPFWEGARRGELRLQRCTACGAFRYPSGRWCAHCRSDASDWVGASGKGEVWSWCVFHKAYFEGFADELPYGVVLVQLDEGVRLYSNLVDVAVHDIRIGMRVHAVFEPVTSEVTLVKFAADT